MLARQEAMQPVWGEVACLYDATKFRKLITEARADGVLPLDNDDVALAVLRYGRLHAAFVDQKYVHQPNLIAEMRPGRKAALVRWVNGVRRKNQAGE